MSTVPPQDRGEGCHTDNWTWPGRREGSLQLAWAARQEGVRALTWVFLAQPPRHWPHWDKSQLTGAREAVTGRCRVSAEALSP